MVLGEERGGPWWGTQRRGVARESLTPQVCLMPSCGELPHPTLLPSVRGTNIKWTVNTAL